MRLIRIILFVSLSSISFLCLADHLVKDAAIGGGIGGAIGGVVGAQAGGRSGAIAGSAAGAAIGAAIATQEDRHHRYTSRPRPVPVSRKNWYQHHHNKSYRHCPPGHAKKGQC